jgi:hypothetical protein
VLKTPEQAVADAISEYIENCSPQDLLALAEHMFGNVQMVEDLRSEILQT